MDQFELGRLTDFDFESVCKDLFEVILGVHLEIFSTGKDEGVDLRYIGTDQKATVIQCKHWMRSGRAALIRQIERVEVPKVHKLAPDRYIY
jgi:Restriction endonuclease